MSSEFDAIFKGIIKDSEKDPNAALFKAGDLNIKSHIPWAIPSGVPDIDINISRPGWPAGRVVELFGFEHCGKTTLAYHALAQAQLMGGSGFFIDTEKSWDEERASQIGIDVDHRFGIVDADSVDAVFRMIKRTLDQRRKHNDGKPFVIVVDSVTGAATEEMHAKEIGAPERIGQDAKAIRGGMRRIVPSVAETNVTLVMVNHATALVTANKYAKQSDSSGGHSIKFHATVRLSMKSSGWIKDKDEVERRLGQKVSLKIEKLKNSTLDYPEIRDITLLNTIGFDTEESLLSAGCKAGWIEHKKGAKTYKLGEDEFSKTDWPSIVMQHGLVQGAYREFLDWCLDNGVMSEWSKTFG